MVCNSALPQAPTTYFKAGTVWKCSYSTYKSSGEESTCTKYESRAFEDENGDLILELQNYLNGTFTQYYMKEDEEYEGRIYIRDLDSTEEDWYLFYDFSYDNSTPQKIAVMLPFWPLGSYVRNFKCYDWFFFPSYEGLQDCKVFRVRTYQDEECSVPYGYSSQTWLNGIGSVQGPESNFSNGEFGGILNEVYSNGQLVYRRIGYDPADVNEIDISEKSGKQYDLQGLPVNTPQKGLVVRNGRLVLVK